MLFKKFDTKKIFVAVLSLFSLLRIYIGTSLPSWIFINSTHDDLLMLDYSALSTHFTQWNINSLAKDISYSIFLFFVHISGLPYTFWLSILWIIAGLLFIYALYKFICKNMVVLALVFIFILFLPIGFDSWCAVRVYRNAIIAPFALITFSTLYIFINNAISKVQNNKKSLIWGIFLGLIFSFTFYIKEDGILLLPIFVASIIGVLIFRLYEKIKQSKELNIHSLAKMSIICLVPLIIFSICTIGYAEVNNYYFGVAEINTRTEGELGEFFKILLEIDDENKSTSVWVPYSTLLKAWDVSPTLQSHPELLECIETSTWAGGNISQNEISGDLLTWCLRECMLAVGLYDNETQTNDFFKQVNGELNDAFENGKLNKSDKIFITRSANGKTLEEIIGLKYAVIKGLGTVLFYEGVNINDLPVPESSHVFSNDDTKRVGDILNNKMVLFSDVNTLHSSVKISIDIINVDFFIYQSISYILVILSFISYIALFIHQIRNRFKDRGLNTVLCFNFMLIGTIFVSTFAVAWFSAWINIDTTLIMMFYTVANQGMFPIFEILSICVGFPIIYRSFKKYLMKNF